MQYFKLEGDEDVFDTHYTTRKREQVTRQNFIRYSV